MSEPREPSSSSSPEPRREAQPAADLGFALPEPARVSRARVVAVGLIVAAVLAGAFVIGWLPRLRARDELARDTQAAAAPTPRVQVIAPKAVSQGRTTTLPGSVLPLEQTVIFPRANGYVRAWHKDIGDKVAEGELLAEIDTPELDQQLAQARAQLAQAEAGLVQAKATAVFSTKTLERTEQLVREGIASKQDLEKQKAQADVDAANVTVAGANAAAQRANIQRLVDLKAYARVVAPFAGTVTSRTVERGALVTEGTATPLFRIAATDPVRVLVQVPQAFAATIRADQPARVTVREHGARAFEGSVARTAGALDPATRTMAAEVRVPNPNGELLAGMFAKVALELSTPHAIYEVPATALVNDAAGTRLAVVGADGHVHFAPVVVERDTGATVEIGAGLEGNERVVKLPSAELREGAAVEVVP